MIPDVLRGLCDDAAIFPPGRLPLAAAVRAHADHRRSAYAELVGPLVLSAASLDALPPLVADLAPGELRVSLTIGEPAALAPALARLAGVPAVEVVSVEVALPPEVAVVEALETVASTLRDGLRPPQGSGPDQGTLAAGRGPGAGAPVDPTPQTYLEVPRDDRRPGVLDALAGGRCRAKFRTGGLTAPLHPSERELAEAIAATTRRGLAYKATAGLHHAVRNTDPETGFEQHGFLNLLLATDAARRGEPVDALTAILAERDGATLAAAVRGLTPDRAASARAGFVSFGTCSITDPLTDLLRLGLVRRPTSEGAA